MEDWKVAEINTLAIATWNTEWREPGSRDGNLIRYRLKALAPDIICLTEAHVGLLHDWGGYIAEGGTDWGGPTFGTRRKALLWSRSPWTDIDIIGCPNLPPGMFVKGMTSTDLGPVSVVGLVIPYHMANVRAGRRDREMWEDHGRYLDALPGIIDALPPHSIVLGDFNQRIPSMWVPLRYQTMLAKAFAPMQIGTTELIGSDGKRSLDHIALGSGLIASGAAVISNLDDGGRQISDHCGVVAQVRAAEIARHA